MANLSNSSNIGAPKSGGFLKRFSVSFWRKIFPKRNWVLQHEEFLAVRLGISDFDSRHGNDPYASDVNPVIRIYEVIEKDSISKKTRVRKEERA